MLKFYLSLVYKLKQIITKKQFNYGNGIRI